MPPPFAPKGGTTIARKALGALLALLALSFVVFVSCGVPGSSDQDGPPPLDDAGRQACSMYGAIHEEVRSGRLTGPSLFRALQDVFNQAGRSATEGFEVQVQGVYSAAIAADQPLLTQRADGLQARCTADD